MKTVDLSPIINTDTEYRKYVDSVREHYTCEWDDAVHDSYSRFVKDVEEMSRRIHEIRSKAETLVTGTDALKVDDLIKTAGNLCTEAHAV